MNQDKVTRGTTHPGRLGALDRALLRRCVDAWRTSPQKLCVVDLGVGGSPETTLELAQALGDHGVHAHVVGVEIDPERVEVAKAWEGEHVSFVQGGIALEPLEEAPHVIRAMNVLRQYRPEEAREVLGTLARKLALGGVLLEGTCDRLGQRLGAHWIERDMSGEIHRRAMLLHTDFSFGFAPWMMRDWLPQDVRRDVTRGSAWWAFFEQWHDAWQDARQGTAPPEAFALGAREFARRGARVETEAWWLQRGYLWWEPEGGVPEAKDLANT